jgi:hypothetical protein
VGRSLSFLSFVFLRRRGCLRARDPTGDSCLGRSELLAVARMSKGKSVLRATLVWGGPSHRAADLRRNGREMSKGKSVSRETLSWRDLGGTSQPVRAAADKDV